jgi:prefoldin subunit 5
VTITPEKLNERLRELRQDEENLLARLNAVGGAIAECEAWKQRLAAPDPEPPPAEPQ